MTQRMTESEKRDDQRQAAEAERRESGEIDRVEDESMDSFPASDPPSFTPEIGVKAKRLDKLVDAAAGGGDNERGAA